MSMRRALQTTKSFTKRDKAFPLKAEQGIRIINLLDAAIYFPQIISLLPHADLTNLTKTASLKARSCRLCRVFTNRMASTSVASALREIREICVKIKCL